MKKEIRIIGIDDSPFDKFKDKTCLIVGAIYRGGQFLDGLVSTRVLIDGTDATAKISTCINSAKFRPQLQYILLKGIAVGGFNVIDIQKLSKMTKLPVLVIVRKYPNFKKMFSAMGKLKMNRRIKTISRAGLPEKINGVYVQTAGMTLATAKKLRKLTCTRSKIPEPLRVAHIITGGIIKGVSRGRA